MLATWHVDDASISIKNGFIEVDDCMRAPLDFSKNARFEIPWKGASVDLLVLRVGYSVEAELWVDDVRIPQNAKGPLLAAPSRCAAHGKRSNRACPICDTVTCRRCRAIDGVRCQACFETAIPSEQQSRRRGWLAGAAVVFVAALALLYAGAQSPSSPLTKAGGSAVFFTGFMIYTALKKRKTLEDVPQESLAFEISNEARQLAGIHCGSCDATIASERDARWCRSCRRALHKSCRKKHRCVPPKTGPDWSRLETGEAMHRE
jgi:hypothetical protein